MTREDCNNALALAVLLARRSPDKGAYRVAHDVMRLHRMRHRGGCLMAVAVILGDYCCSVVWDDGRYTIPELPHITL